MGQNIYKEEFEEAEKTKEINLYKKNIDQFDFDQIPKTLRNVTSLDLSYNSLDNIDKKICMMSNLIQLTLSGNNLSSLPDEISQLTTLKRLRLNFNQFEVSINQCFEVTMTMTITNTENSESCKGPLYLFFKGPFNLHSKMRQYLCAWSISMSSDV
eukprot:TRINITY_DN2372_c0_g3_i1.p1 TRINITY_DN2372_c0_g3~~TRINITY_DN2372_c0_g3_i1.p1  ORF type:complete len:156 (-),score=12.15 TRINITY_DN2372_c0_g3_i1:185-652(-)